MKNMDKEKLKEILLDQKFSFTNKRNLIDRDIFLDMYLSTSQIVVISGVRRCGKSSLLSIIKNKLSLNEEDYCYFNFDDERIVANVNVMNDIYALHLELYKKEPIFFFDEIQVIKGWEKFVNRMYESGHKIFVTGSNAKLLSSEISTSLTGRNKVIDLFPFSFSEYLLYINHKYDFDRLTTKQKSLLLSDFQSYLEYGGFPLVVKENDIDIINSWFQDILYRDIVSRYNLVQVNEIKLIALYLFSNIGKRFSYSTLKSISEVKSLSSIKNYLHYFELSYLFFYLSKFDFSMKKQIGNSKKVYTIDNAVANKLGFRFSENKGRLLENLVFLELLRRGKEIYYFSEKYECDFLVKEGVEIVEAIQVTYDLNILNKDREFNGLKEAMNRYNIKNGIIIINDSTDIEIEDNNIRVIPAYKWLCSASQNKN